MVKWWMGAAVLMMDEAVTSSSDGRHSRMAETILLLNQEMVRSLSK